MKHFACRIHWELRGGHVHVHVFSDMVSDEHPDSEYALARSGDLVFAAREWPDARERLSHLGTLYEVVGGLVRV